ncbi:hypothetical protein ACIBQ0_17240 [Nocardia nova]|uniref:hypothetical protein n=1 Tax=Nocardia nova TaxID=37330 RepID=UPI00378D73F7
MVEALAAREETRDDEEPQVPIEGFGTVEARLANIEDRLGQLVCVIARSDPAGIPTAARPVYPHKTLREQQRRAAMRAFELLLIPGGDDG